MALAYGYGHVGFGLGFLNFIGSVLFIVFLFMVFKFAFRGMRYSTGNTGPWAWRSKGRSCSKGHTHHDEAMQIARERLAQSEVSPEDFEAIKEGLKSQGSQEESMSPWSRKDSALTTARVRFAKGDITLEEFEAVKKALMS